MPQVKSEEVTLSKDLSLIDVGTRVMAPRSRGERQVAEIKNPGIPQDSQDSIGGANPATPGPTRHYVSIVFQKASSPARERAKGILYQLGRKTPRERREA